MQGSDRCQGRPKNVVLLGAQPCSTPPPHNHTSQINRDACNETQLHFPMTTHDGGGANGESNNLLRLVWCRVTKAIHCTRPPAWQQTLSQACTGRRLQPHRTTPVVLDMCMICQAWPTSKPVL